MKLTIEYLFYDAATLFGDNGHYLYFDRLFADHTIVRTALTDRPAFVSGHVDLIYLGAMSERVQRVALERLRPHRERLSALIEGGTHVLLTCTAMDLLGRWIDYDGERVEGLGLFDFTVTSRRWPRLNQFVLGDFEGLAITGHKSQFTTTHFGPGMASSSFYTVIRGLGAEPGEVRDGVHHRHLYATQCMGPFFVLNPPLMKRILRELNMPDTLPAERAQTLAYERRLAEFRDPKTEQVMTIS